MKSKSSNRSFPVRWAHRILPGKSTILQEPCHAVHMSARAAKRVESQMEQGRYPSEDALPLDAIQALGEVERRQRELRDEIQSRLADVGTGLAKPLDVEAFRSEARRRLRAEGRYRIVVRTSRPGSRPAMFFRWQLRGLPLSTRWWNRGHPGHSRHARYADALSESAISDRPGAGPTGCPSAAFRSRGRFRGTRLAYCRTGRPEWLRRGR